MKTAIYVEDGVTQLVLTPETDFERGAMAIITDKSLTTEIFNGAFYDCRGGWTRQSTYYPTAYGDGDYKYSSIIIRITKKQEVNHDSKTGD